MGYMFPVLPILDDLTRLCPKQSKDVMAQTVFVCVQHILPTTGSLFKSLIDLGAIPSNIFVMGKCYSTNMRVLEDLRKIGIIAKEGKKPSKHGSYRSTMDDEVVALWKMVEDKKNQLPSARLIIIDDGGQCVKSRPKWTFDFWIRSIGIEQTTNGLKSEPERPVRTSIIEVASSAAKCQIESPMIAEAISSYVCQLASAENFTKYGIVGYGNIGKAVCRALHQRQDRQYEIFIYDKNLKCNLNAEPIPEYIMQKDSIRALVEASEVILGCTGEDILPNRKSFLKHMSSSKLFASCSSGDYEFNHLLEDEKFYRRQYGLHSDVLDDVSIGYRAGHKITILRGGFPVNFDRQREIEPALDIQLTRGLLLGAVIQSTAYFSRPDGTGTSPNKMLDPFIQRQVVNTWRKTSLTAAEFSDNFTDIEWIKQESGGSYDDMAIDNFKDFPIN
jgi:S-adenosylhomocysteine hydrolase